MNRLTPGKFERKRGPMLRISLCLLLLGFIPLISGCSSTRAKPPLLALLDRPFANARPLEVRLTDQNHAPFIETRGEASIGGNDAELRRAELEILTAATESETPENIHALGRLYLVKNERKKALATLQRASAITNADPRLPADHGAAYLASVSGRPGSGEDLRAVFTALEYFDVALRLSPEMPEPLFNRAIALSKLGIHGQAVKAWKAYLLVDPNSSWSEEARARLDGAVMSINVPASRDERFSEFISLSKTDSKEKAFEILSINREMITEDLIPQQLLFRMCEAEVDSAVYSDLLAALRWAGDIEYEKTGDPFWKSAGDFYARAGEPTLSKICRGHALVRSGFTRTLANEHEAAEVNFTQAGEIFRRASSETDVLIVDYWLGYIDQQTGRIKASEARLMNANRIAEAKGYLWISSQYITWLANIDQNKDVPVRRIEKAEKALLIAEKLNDHYQKLRCLDILASAYISLGSADRAANQISKSLPLTEVKFSSPRQRWRTLSFAGEAIASFGGYSAAESVLQEAIELNRSWISENSFEYYAQLQIAQVESIRKENEKALASVEESRKTLDGFDPGTRERHSIYLDLVNAHILRNAGRCDEALPLYDRTNLFNELSESVLDRFDGRRGELLCQIARGDLVNVTAKVPAILADLDRYRTEIRSESFRNSFFGNAQQVFDSLIAFESENGNAEKAFEYAEMSRARSLLDMVTGGFETKTDADATDLVLSERIARPLDLKSVIERVPDRTQLLMYSVLEDRVLIWSIRQGSFEMRRSNVPKKRLETIVREFFASVSMPGRTSLTGAELEEALIGPVRDLIEPANTLVIIPDKSISKVPFAALPAKGSDRFLIEHLMVQYAPSATLFIGSGNGRPVSERSSETILAIGDPAFDPQFGSSLPRLAEAKREAVSIAQLYTDAAVLTDADATSKNIIERIGRANVLHFAGHYVYNTGSPMDGRFLIAGKGRETLISGIDLIGKHQHNIGLAVLSACTTGSEMVIDGEGMIGAARMFLANGVPEVVASHWEIDSATSSRMMINFHKNRKLQKMSTSGALRAAQLELINNPDQTTRDPYYWAAFFLLGSNGSSL